MRDIIGRRIRETTLDGLLGTALERSRWKVAFANLVSGRFTELLFRDSYKEPLGAVGIDLIEEVAERNFLDYRLVASDRSEQFALSVNVKNAGRQMREAETFFGLKPEDTLPMATYKAFGSEAAAIPPLLYVYLVDWDLLEQLRATYWERILSEDEQVAFRLLANFKGFSRDLEDDFITATVDHRLNELREGVGYSDQQELPFRAVSAALCRSIFYEHHGRSPYVYVRRMNTDPNVHISVSKETLPFLQVIEEHLATPADRASLLSLLGRTKQLSIPDPPL